VFSIGFENPSVHPQEDLYMQFYGISFMHPYKQSRRWQDVLDAAIWYTKTCRQKEMTPNYISIKVNGNNRQFKAHPAIDQTAYMDV
jgi:hypothetical protein